MNKKFSYSQSVINLFEQLYANNGWVVLNVRDLLPLVNNERLGKNVPGKIENLLQAVGICHSKIPKDSNKSVELWIPALVHLAAV